MQPQDSHAEFPATPWTYIEALKSKDHPRHAEALEALSSRYWPPIYAYLRRLGKTREDAAEIAQAFFAEVVLERRLFERAECHRGRLRTLILIALKRYVVDQSRRRSMRRADITLSLERLEQEEAIVSADSSNSAEQAFDRRWATTVLEKALARCEQHFLANGRGRHWHLFETRVLLPSVAMIPPPPLTQAALEAGFRSPAEAAGALRTVRKRAMVLLYEVVAETAQGREDQEAEYRQLQSMLG